jgi:hypothetical protein
MVMLTSKRIERKDFIQEDKDTSAFLNSTDIQGRTQENQNKPFYYNFISSGSFVLTQNVVITQIHLDLSLGRSGATATANATATIRGTTTHQIDLYLSALGGNDSKTSDVKINNWILLKGETIGAVLSHSAGSGGDGSVSFIGYLV